MPPITRQPGYVDDNGTVRAMMNSEGIFYYDENEAPRAAMSIESIDYWDENGDEVWSTDCAPNC